jgi:hypothetical protein
MSQVGRHRRLLGNTSKLAATVGCLENRCISSSLELPESDLKLIDDDAPGREIKGLWGPNQ